MKKMKLKMSALVAAALFAGVYGGINAAADDNITITMVESLTSAERTAIIREIADKYEARTSEYLH